MWQAMYKLYYTHHNMWSSHLLKYRYDSPWPRTELPEAYVVWEHRTFWLKQLCCPQDVILLPRCYTSFQDVPTTFPRRDIRHAHKNFQASAWRIKWHERAMLEGWPYSAITNYFDIHTSSSQCCPQIHLLLSVLKLGPILDFSDDAT